MTSLSVIIHNHFVTMFYYIAGKRIRPLRIISLVLGLLIIVLLLKRFSSTDEVEGSMDPVDDLNAKDDGYAVNHKGNSIGKGREGADINNEVIDPINKEFLRKLDKKIGSFGKCPDYVEYSKIPHPPFSLGEFKYPFMRPAPKCRTFVSEAIEALIVDLKKKVNNPDLARLIENCLPNTLDTTILWHTNKDQQDLQSFVVTGDIHAEWLRDAARQLSVYQPFIKYDEPLRQLILGAINTQANYVSHAPYCNAFHPPAKLGVKRGQSAVDSVFPRPDWHVVFECKWELDSLASFLTLTNEYYENSSGDKSFINDQWLHAFQTLLIVLRRESQPSFDEETGRTLKFSYSFQRQTNIGSETLPLGGVGNPVNYGTGLIRSAFRPSDDATIFQFFIPANAQMLTELMKARSTFLQVGVLKELVHGQDALDHIQQLCDLTDKFITNIKEGISKHGVVDHPIWGKIYAYEVDGYGGVVSMDDANIPSLLSLPDMGFIKDINDPIYQNTRKMILSKAGNPYFLEGAFFQGIGGHILV